MLLDSIPQIHFNYEGDGFPSFFAIVFLIVLILLHLACGMGILESAGRYAQKHGSTVLLSRLMWAIVGFLGGPWGLGLYWLLHLSTLNPAQSAHSPQTSPPPAAPESRP